MKARPVPIGKKKSYDVSMKKLMDNGLWYKVPYSEWASPIHAVYDVDGKGQE
jgi:hypothetical protein